MYTHTHNVHLTFELSEVIALLSRDSLSLRETAVAMEVSTSIARSVASWKESEMVVGCIPSIVRGRE